MKLQSFYIFLFSLGLLFTDGSRSFGQTSNLRIAFNGFGGTAPIFLGQDAGIFRKQNLNLELIFIPGGSLSLQALIGRSLELLLTGGPPVVNAYLQGAKIKIIAGMPLLGFRDLVANKIPEQFPDLKFGFIEAAASWVPFLIHIVHRLLKDKFRFASSAELFREYRLYVACEADEDIRYLAKCMPGLVNAHTHLYQVLLRAVWEDLELMPWLRRIYGCARVLRPEHFYAGSLLGCVEALRGGVTTVCEHNFLNPNLDCAFETIRAIENSGVRGVFARTIMDRGEIVPDCTKEKPEQAFRQIENLLSQHQNRHRLRFMAGPNTPPINTTPELLRELRQFADNHSLGISAHVAESKSIVQSVQNQHGKNGVVEFLAQFDIPAANSIFAHSVHVSEKEIGILRETGTSVSHNPVSNMICCLIHPGQKTENS